MVITVDGSAKGKGHIKSRAFFHELHCKKKCQTRFFFRSRDEANRWAAILRRRSHLRLGLAKHRASEATRALSIFGLQRRPYLSTSSVYEFRTFVSPSLRARQPLATWYGERSRKEIRKVHFSIKVLFRDVQFRIFALIKTSLAVRLQVSGYSISRLSPRASTPSTPNIKWNCTCQFFVFFLNFPAISLEWIQLLSSQKSIFDGLYGIELIPCIKAEILWINYGLKLLRS